MKVTIEKEYDCVESVRIAREKIAKDTEGKTPKEILDYFKRSKKKNPN